jgi:hypothetical protein
MALQCWICRREADPHAVEELLTSLLANLKRRRAVQGCPVSCEVLLSRSDVIWARLYRLHCGHYCANHTDHRCCNCWAQGVSVS